MSFLSCQTQIQTVRIPAFNYLDSYEYIFRLYIPNGLPSGAITCTIPGGIVEESKEGLKKKAAVWNKTFLQWISFESLLIIREKTEQDCPSLVGEVNIYIK